MIMGGIAGINFIMAVAGLLIAVIGLSLSLSEGILDKKTKSFFASFFIILFIYALSDLLGQLVAGRPGENWILTAQVALFIESFSSSVLTVQITYFLFFQSRGKTSGNPVLHAVLLMWGVYVAFLISTGFSGAFYFFDDGNNYQRGPLYPVLLLPPILIMIVNLFALWKERARLSSKQKHAFLLYTLIPLASMILQMLFYGLYFIILGTSIGSLCMLRSIALDQIERYKQKELENAQLKIDILMAQIQPHFIFNTLGTIRQLCGEAPEAEHALSLFADFLRHNMESLTQNHPIPFQTELEQVKGYLELLKLRFGEDLRICFDLETTEFRIPTLTLQTLTENAVRYGVRGNEDGRGTVRIRTRDRGDHVELEVEDDGPGFDLEKAPSEERQHIGLRNVRERMKSMNCGEMKIDSSPGRGCRVTILIPKETDG